MIDILEKIHPNRLLLMEMNIFAELFDVFFDKIINSRVFN